MNIYSIQTPFNIELKVKTATLGRRLLAWLIDYIVVFFYSLLMVLLLFGSFNKISELNAISSMDAINIFLVILIVIPIVFYHLISQVITNGRSIGKMIMKLKVVNVNNGGSVGISQLAIRNILYFPNFLMVLVVYATYQPLFLVLVFGIIAFFSIPDVIFLMVNEKNQRIGDLVAGTMLIQSNYNPDISLTIFQEVSETSEYQIVYSNVSALSDVEINGLYKIVKSPRNYSPEYLGKIVQRLESKLKANSLEIDALDFFQAVIKDYNHYHQKGKNI